jgi:hypothetical protein
LNNQSSGGLDQSGAITRMASRQTSCKRSKISRRFRRPICPAGTMGATRARQRISSAIQFPTPGNTPCMSKTALIGAPARRSKKASICSKVNASDNTSGGKPCNHSGKPSQAAYKIRPNIRES